MFVITFVIKNEFRDSNIPETIEKRKLTNSAICS